MSRLVKWFLIGAILSSIPAMILEIRQIQPTRYDREIQRIMDN